MQTGPVRTGGPVVTSWSATSAFGAGADALRSGLLAGRPAAAGAPDPAGELVRPVPGFDAREVLGRKGTRSMDRVTALSLATLGGLTERVDVGDAAGRGTRARTAIVLGTTTGSAQSMSDFTRSSITGQRPFLVDAARFPNTVMNCAAGQCAIWYGLTGPNATIAGGRTAGLLALAYARRLQRADRAATVLCGAAEEASATRSWLARRSRPAGRSAGVLGEGCVVLRLEPPSPGSVLPPERLAEVAALEFGVAGGPGGADAGTVLAGCLRRATTAAGVRPADVWAVALSAPPGADGERERAAVAAVLGDPQAVACTELLGDTSAVSAVFGIAALLAHAGAVQPARDLVGVVTAIDDTGSVGCAVLRLRAGADR